ncbi:MAG TPA: hypothetical protein VFX76_18520 [Roseiflexaceae bacterium]|nr:hypothetical protein [Roseiflexaceae bacterium]
MPPQSRAQRRRQSARQQQQRRPSQPAPSVESVREPVTGPTVALDPAPAAPVRAASRNQRRVLSRPALEPVDYTADYTAVRRDLRWIALWTVLLFAAMLALKFSGLV